MTDHSRVALVGAFGGTYVSLAVSDIDELTISHFALLNSADFDSPTQAIERYLHSLPSVPNKVALSVAGSVHHDKVVMDHLPWHFDRNDIRAATGAEHVCFINEFDGLAMALPNLSRYELTEIAAGQHVKHGTRLAVASGSGFGAAALVWHGDTRIPVSGPSRHMHFTPAPVPGLDLAAIFAESGTITTESVFSGRGLMALYRALAAKGGTEPALNTAPEVTKLGLANEDPAAALALQIMAKWLGGFAGDLALSFGARGGVYLGGGMLANIVPLLQAPEFRGAFLGTGDRRAYLSEVGIHVIKTGADAGLRGAAIALSQSLPTRPARATLRS